MLKSSAVAASDHCRRAGPDGEAADVLRFPESTAAGERASARVGKLEPEGGRVRVLARGDAAGRGEGGGGGAADVPRCVAMVIFVLDVGDGGRERWRRPACLDSPGGRRLRSLSRSTAKSGELSSSEVVLRQELRRSI